MSAQQAEFVAFKSEVAASAANVAASIKRLEEVVTKTNSDVSAAAAAIVRDLREMTTKIMSSATK